MMISMDYKAYFNGKKVTMMGLGILGRGVGDALFLAQSGAILTVTDLKNEEELKESITLLKKFKNITFHLGGHKKEDFVGRDLILKAAGVELDSPFIKEARENNIPVEMSSALFCRLSPAKIVGITGTRGKSTVAHLLHAVLREAGKDVFLGGNVKGVSTLAHLPESTPEEIAVLELDSWQLQGFGEDKISPPVSVFTTFMPDHLNYYNGNLDAYLSDKSNIFKYQSEKDILILGSQCAELIRQKYPDIKSKIIVSDPADISNWQIELPGEHNLYDAACAARAAQAIGVSDEIIKKAIENFKGVPGRLELVREVRGVKIYNDTTATTPDATVAALRAIGKDKNIILIMGGADKGLSLDKLIEEIPKYCKKVFLLSGTGSDKLKSPNLKFIETKTLNEAVKEAIRLAGKYDIVLFSPAFASFGPPPGGFRNEYERGEEFMKLVKKS